MHIEEKLELLRLTARKRVWEAGQRLEITDDSDTERLEAEVVEAGKLAALAYSVPISMVEIHLS